jgi:serine phosphatase RsbU (regulator of sigma subunit)/DNA-binding response OmpR family regulator
VTTPEPQNAMDAGDAAATILVIDDSPENRYVVRRALTRAGMTVLEAATGAEGIVMAAELPDLVVCDVNLPDTNGFELCRQIKSDPETAHLPVIHLSQSAVDDSSQVRGLEGGADAYLTDPVHGSVLVATVRALLRVRQAEDQLRQAAEDNQRMVDLTNDIAVARSEPEVVLALVEAVDRVFAVERATSFAAYQWATAPKIIFARQRESPAEPLPLTREQVERLVSEIIDEEVHENRVFYDGDRARHLLVLPLLAYGEEMATLLIEFADGIVFPLRNQARLALAGERVAQAMERARLYERQREIAFDLQSSLLPVALPEVPGVELAADYRAGAEQMVVGGDFYDVFPGSDGWIAIIGDVAGRGAAAAARTSLARHTAREAARHDDHPAKILTALNRAIDADKRSDQLDLITSVCLRLSPGDGGVAVSFAIAGHPLPILVKAHGEAATVGTPEPILGLDPGVQYTSEDLWLAPGDVLFLYTDGLTESRRSGVLFGEERLNELLSEMVPRGASIQRLAAEPIRAASSYNEVHDDDMATLVIRAAQR